MSTISAGTTSTTTLIHSGDTTGSLVLKTNDTGSGGTTAVTIDTSQNVGIGTSSPSAPATVKGRSADGIGIRLLPPATTTTYTSIQWTDDPVTQEYSAVLGDTSKNLVFRTNNSERMRINSNGKILFNTTTQNNNEQVGMVYSSNAGVGFSIKDSNAQSGNTFIEFRNGTTVAGTITSNGTTTMTYGSASDYRLKENLVPLTGALAKLVLLQPKVGNWKVDGSEFVGFVAHELQEVFPDAVVGEKDRVDADGNPLHQMVDTGSASIIATLTAAIQELKALVDNQASTITQLQADVAALKGTS